MNTTSIEKKTNLTLNNVFEEWIELEAKHRYQYNSIVDYQNRYKKHLRDKLGMSLLFELDYKNIQTYFNENYDIGIATNTKIKEILNILMNFAIRCGYIEKNPIPFIHIIGKDKTRNSKKTLSDEDFELVVQELLSSPSYIRYSYAIALYIGKYTGLRISEVFALNKEDISLSEKYVDVSKKIIYADMKRKDIYVSNQMKSKSSYAKLPLHQNLEEILIKWFEFHKFQHIISDKSGNYLNPKQLEYTLWKISKKLNIDFHFHMLRHTLASKLVNHGANIKATQELLRHASISTTMNIYTHADDHLKKDALNLAFMNIENQNK